MKIYVASSWRNVYYEEVVRCLREAGHEVYDFRIPTRQEPELMYKLFDGVCCSVEEVIQYLCLSSVWSSASVSE